MQKLLDSTEFAMSLGLAELKVGNEGVKPLALLDAEMVASRFPCFDLNREINAYSDHSSGGGYLNSRLKA